MYYQTDELERYFQEHADGRTPEQYVSEAVNSLLDTWLTNERGQGEYKQTGGFWEALHPILFKIAPQKAGKYENVVGGFTEFDDKVKDLFDEGSDIYNVLGALLYIKERENSFATPQDIHQIDLGNDEIMPYIPNQSINSKDFWGREDQNGGSN
jgi:hypothetical protein